MSQSALDTCGYVDFTHNHMTPSVPRGFHLYEQTRHHDRQSDNLHGGIHSQFLAILVSSFS